LTGQDYTLVIAEKADAAERIASSISKEKVKKKTELNVPYFEFNRNGRRVVVVPASGHLYTVTQKRGGRNYYPVYTLKWVPKFTVERGSERTKNMVKLIEKLSRAADELVNAADYDIEGSLIGYTILKYACGERQNEAKRMKFSTLTRDELIHAYENLMPHLDFELAEAGQTRHEVDWLYGVNLSRALTLSALKQAEKYVTLSIGRVQGPTLQLVVQREVEIRSFVPTPYWEIDTVAEIQKNEYKLSYEKDRLEREKEALEIAARCSGKTGEIFKIDEKEVRRAPLDPFDLGTLQNEAYRFFRYNPRRTLDIAERLYLDALTSYPRTSSQKLPPTINYRNVLEGLLKNKKYEKNAKRLLSQKDLTPKQGKKEDPAHPAIYPTGKPPERELSAHEAKVYDIVVKRFMATFGKPTVSLRTQVSIECGGHNYFLHGRRIIDEGWISLYRPYVEAEETILPWLSVGQKILLKSVESISKFTEPQRRYNPASLLKVMEENGIGTKATRADIIETLYERGYLRDERMEATEIGFTVIKILSKHCPEITSFELTRNIEDKMEKIEKKIEQRANVLKDAVAELGPILGHLKSREKAIGVELAQAIKTEALRRRFVGSCPECKTGNLIILRSRRTHKQFIGCTNFFTGKCKKSLPLPQRARVSTTDRTCKTCSWPIIVVKWAKRRPFQVCINPECPAKPKK